MDKSKKFKGLEFLAIKILKQLDIEQPNKKQVHLMQSLLLDIGVIFFRPTFDLRLSSQEIACLFWTTKGKTGKQIAKLLNVKPSTVKAYQDRIRVKLNCKTMAQAVYEAIRFSVLPMELHMAEDIKNI